MPNSGFNETASPTIEMDLTAAGLADAGPTGVESPTARLEIRDLDYADLPPVLSIERRSFPSPWSVGMFALEMSKPDTIALAAETDSGTAGYLIMSRYDRAWHLMNIGVAPECRRRGIASRLILAAFRRIDDSDPVTLEVRTTNHSAIELYEGFGFRSFGLRKGYYPDNGEDALIMWKGDPAVAGVPF